MSKLFTGLLFSVLFASNAVQAAFLCDLFSPEAEKQLKKLNVSLDGTVDNGELKEGLLPRGAALITSSGALAQTGITAIVHAASGSMNREGGHFEPTLESIRNSVANSVKLAEGFGHQRIAIPLVGGGIFLDRLGIEASELAKNVIAAATNARKTIEIIFVGLEADVAAFKRAGATNAIVGSLVDGRAHGASAIVNAANTEVIFGGGLSGVIAKASKSKDAINQEAQEIIGSLKSK